MDNLHKGLERRDQQIISAKVNVEAIGKDRRNKPEPSNDHNGVQ